MEKYLYVGRDKIKCNLTSNESGISVEFPFHRGLIDELKSFQLSHYNPDSKVWSFPHSCRNTYALRFLTKKHTDAQNRYFLPIPHKAAELDLTQKLWAHQVEMFDFGSFRRRVILASEPRTGKTLPTLFTFYHSVFPICNFVTTSSAYLGIIREVRKWFHPEELQVVESMNPVTLADIQYKHSVKRKYINLFTYDGFKKLSTSDSSVCGFWVFDELHKMKEDTSIRSDFGLELSAELERNYGGDEYIIGLTGTPAPKDPTDWWMQCEIIRPGFIREGDRKKFKNRYGIWKEGTQWPEFSGWNEEELKKLTQRISPMVRVYLQRDVMDLPDVIHEVVRLEPTAEMNRIAGIYKKTISNSMALRTKLHQLSDGFSYSTEYDELGNKMRRTGFNKIAGPKEAQVKIDLEELIDSEGNARCVYYSAFQASVDIITEVSLSVGYTVLQIDGRGKKLVYLDSDGKRVEDNLQSSVISALDEMDRTTNSFRIKKLVVNAETEAGGTGLEFSSSSIIIYYSNSDVGEGKMQSWRRAYSNNMDKSKGLTLREYYCLPIDEDICNKHDIKANLQKVTMTFDKV